MTEVFSSSPGDIFWFLKPKYTSLNSINTLPKIRFDIITYNNYRNHYFRLDNDGLMSMIDGEFKTGTITVTGPLRVTDTITSNILEIEGVNGGKIIDISGNNYNGTINNTTNTIIINKIMVFFN